MAARHAVCCFKHSSSALRFSYLSHESYFRVNPWPPVTSIRRRRAEQDFENIKRKIYTGPLYQKARCGRRIFRHGLLWISQTRSGCKVHCPIFTQALRDTGGAPCFINGRKQPTFAPRTRHRWEEISTGLKRFKVTFINRILQICTSFWLEMRHHLLNTTQAVCNIMLRVGWAPLYRGVWIQSKAYWP